MLNKIEDLKNDRQLVNSIDWSMTPEKAVDMYLEWGSGWIRGHDFVKTANDESVYFVLYDWETTPQATLIKRNMREAVEIAKVAVPSKLFDEACREDGKRPGGTVHRLNTDLIKWLSDQISGTGDSITNIH